MQVVSDPLNQTTHHKNIPGAIVEFTVTIRNEGPGNVDSGSLAITDVVSACTRLYVGTGGGDPVVFSDGPVPSGLTYDFSTDVGVSNQPGGGAPFNYVPVPDAGGFDPAVTGLRINPGGTMNGAADASVPSFMIRFRVLIDSRAKDAEVGFAEASVERGAAVSRR